MLLTTDEIALALNTDPDTAKDQGIDLLDIWGEAQNFISDRIEFESTYVAQTAGLLSSHAAKLVDYMRKRQLVRIYKDEIGRYFVHHENILDPEDEYRLKWQRLLIPSDDLGLPEDSFEELLEGHVSFIYPSSHSANQHKIFYHHPDKHFSNWKDFPELHKFRVMALDECDSVTDHP